MAIPRTHSDLVKFAYHDSEYDKVISILRRVKSVSEEDQIYQMDEKDHNCLQRLRERATNPRADKSRIERTKGGLSKDLCNWIFENPTFQRWHSDDNCRLLWVKGDPGKGKTSMLLQEISSSFWMILEIPAKDGSLAPDSYPTFPQHFQIRTVLTPDAAVLLCSIIDHLCQAARPTQPYTKTLLSFFLCQGIDSRLNNATAVLCGLLYLLAVQQPSVVSHVREEYDHAGETLFRDANAWDTLSRIFSNILRDPKLKMTCLIIDGLDECETDLPLLLDFISDNSSPSLPVKWIVSSRNNPDIQRKLRVDESGESLSLELKQNAEYVAQAVKAYIQRSVLELPSIRGDTILQEKIREKMQRKANGTFLWVSLVMEELKEVQSWEVEEVVDETPGDLKKLYERMFKQINQLKRGSPELCRLILSAATTAYRPLHLAELAVLSGLPRQISEKLQSVTAIVNLCHSFLTVRNENVYIVHQSARDFLKQAFETTLPAGIEDMHHAMFSRSLQLLSQKLRDNIYGLSTLGIVNRVTPPSPDPLVALGYSCIHWADHACEASSLRHHNELSDDGPAFSFLKSRFLHWLESLSLLGKLPQGAASIKTLLDKLEVRRLRPKMNNSC